MPAPYFHGGARKLHKGDIVLPPSKTGAPSLSGYGGQGVTRRDRVYIIDSVEDARFYALLAPPKGRGSVYEVEPIGELEIDPDYLGGDEALAVPMARVLRVVERLVTEWNGFSAAEAAALINYDGDQHPHGARLHDLGAATGGGR